MATLNAKRLATKLIDTAGNLLLGVPFGGFGFFHNHGPRTARKVALTFDDGPSRPSTENLLDAMDALNVRGTFFWVGAHVQRYPELVQQAYAAGHVIGNHSMLHSRKAGLMLNGGAHIDDSAHEIAKVIGRQPQLYRPPWGWLTPWEGRRLSQRGYKVIGWDVYTLDWKVPELDGGTIAQGICRDVHPGSIILLHDAYAVVSECHKSEMVRTVQQVVPQLRAEGYEFVTIPELLGIPAYVPLK
jgi:peptidoglycan/xylan/chitin deacetylase (PgdA/CDA1 family)